MPVVIADLNAFGPVRAAQLALSARNEAARQHNEASTVRIEIVRPSAMAATTGSGTGRSTASPGTERLVLDIAV